MQGRGRFVLIPLLVGALCAGACSSSSHRATNASSTTIASPTTVSPTTAAETPVQRAADAYVWGYPLVVTERTLQLLALRSPVNHLSFQTALATAASRAVVAPNADTLYATAALDLRGEPYVLRVPAIHDRYYVFQLLDAYTNSFGYIGTRATGGRAGTFAVTPPGWHGTLPAGVTRISSPTPQVAVLGRFLVANDADVTNVLALSKRISLEPLSSLTGAAPAPTPPPIGLPAGRPQTVGANGAAFFDELGDALAVNPPSDPRELQTMRSFAVLGIGPGFHPSTNVAERGVLARGVRAGETRIDTSGGISRAATGGWSVDMQAGSFGHDALERAVVAKNGWGANIPQEAVYAHATVDGSGHKLTGAHRYVVHFPRGGLPPVNAFWSVTMYGPDRFFVANSINRYAIGDRSAGLRYGNDGSLDLYLQHDAPAGHESNWLPAPVGAFSLSLRLYLPKASVLNGTYHYPAITAVG